MWLFAGTYEKKTVMGRKLPKLPTQSELRRRAKELVKLRQEHAVDPERSLGHLAFSKPVPADFGVFFKEARMCAPLFFPSLAEIIAMCPVLLLGRDAT